MTQHYAVIGDPVSHSISPQVHNAAFKAMGLDCTYTAMCIKPEEAMRLLREGRLDGINVTIPFKEAIIPLLDEVDPLTQKIGAVNTVVKRDGRLIGFNTDVVGAMQSLCTKTVLRGKKAVVLGAGGSARAIVYGLLQEGAQVHIWSRTSARAYALAAEFGAHASEDVPDGDILINTTPVGMHPNRGQMPIESSMLKKFVLVFDIIYTPRPTRVLQEAANAGCTTIDGLEMFIGQAAEAYLLWTGKLPDKEIMRTAALQALAERQ